MDVYLLLDEDEDVHGIYTDKMEAMDDCAGFNDGDGYFGTHKIQKWEVSEREFYDAECNEPIEGVQVQRIGKGENAEWYECETIKHASELEKIYEIDDEEDVCYSVFLEKVSLNTKEEWERRFNEYEEEQIWLKTHPKTKTKKTNNNTGTANE